MKRITASQRIINIVSRATELGFEFDQTNSLEDIRIDAEDYLVENDDATEEYCKVESTSNSQVVSYNDGHGYEYVCSGEIVNWSNCKVDSQGRVFHTTILDSEGKVVRLYDTMYTYDVLFNDSADSNSKGMRATIEECKKYISMYNGTNHSYFEDYKGGTVSVVCNETGETVYEEDVK